MRIQMHKTEKCEYVFHVVSGDHLGERDKM